MYMDTYVDLTVHTQSIYTHCMYTCINLVDCDICILLYNGRMHILYAEAS